MVPIRLSLWGMAYVKSVDTDTNIRKVERRDKSETQVFGLGFAETYPVLSKYNKSQVQGKRG